MLEVFIIGPLGVACILWVAYLFKNKFKVNK